MVPTEEQAGTNGPEGWTSPLSSPEADVPPGRGQRADIETLFLYSPAYQPQWPNQPTPGRGCSLLGGSILSSSKRQRLIAKSAVNQKKVTTHYLLRISRVLPGKPFLKAV